MLINIINKAKQTLKITGFQCLLFAVFICFAGINIYSKQVLYILRGWLYNKTRLKQKVHFKREVIKIQAAKELERLLEGLGNTPITLKRYLNLLLDGDCPGSEKLRLLKVMRFSLLEDIHDKQQLLDNVDYAVHRIKQERNGKDDDK